MSLTRILLSLNCSKEKDELQKVIEVRLAKRECLEAVKQYYDFALRTGIKKHLQETIIYGIRAIDLLQKEGKQDIKQIINCCDVIIHLIENENNFNISGDEDCLQVSNIDHFNKISKTYDECSKQYVSKKDTISLKEMLFYREHFYSVCKKRSLLDNHLGRDIRLQWSHLIEAALHEQNQICNTLNNIDKCKNIVALLGQHYIDFAIQSSSSKEKEASADWKKATEYQENDEQNKDKLIFCYERIISIESSEKNNFTKTLEKLIKEAEPHEAYPREKLAYHCIGLAFRTKEIEDWIKAIEACGKIQQHHTYNQKMGMCCDNLAQLYSEQKFPMEQVKKMWENAAQYYYLDGNKSLWNKEKGITYFKCLNMIVENQTETNSAASAEEQYNLEACRNWLKNEYRYFINDQKSNMRP